MGYIILEAAVCMLAIYGLIMLVLAAVEKKSGSGRGPRKHPGVRVVLLVKDAEEQIEYIIRKAVKSDVTSGLLSENSLVVIDMNSSDSTFLLLEKLQKDFSCVEILPFEDRALVFEELPIFSHPQN